MSKYFDLITDCILIAIITFSLTLGVCLVGFRIVRHEATSVSYDTKDYNPEWEYRRLMEEKKLEEMKKNIDDMWDQIKKERNK